MPDDRSIGVAQQRIVGAAEEQGVHLPVAGDERLEVGAEDRFGAPAIQDSGLYHRDELRTRELGDVGRGSASTIAAGYAPDSTVPAVAMTPT